MQRLIALGLTAMCLWGCDPGEDPIILTLEQRSTARLDGLGFDGRASIRIGDIESSDLVDRRVEIEEIEIFGTRQGDGNTLLAVEDATTFQRSIFDVEGVAYALTIDRIDTDLLFEDTADITITYE